jgi:two-component system sensor histidine kinase KdpD
MPIDGRPDPDALIAAAAAEAKGRLKIFLGAAPGVGKTWEMLVQAKRRQVEGVDVLCGVVETHGRAGTEAELKGLPVLPQREVAYRGQVLREFDVDAALTRRPGLLLVDELAHTNAPGSRHAKRWEDVLELVAAGINVWATLNVQHLESLNDDIARMTGVRVTETLPDRVLDEADEIELIDVPPAELRERLREGRIYRPDQAARALDGFFKEGNLASLREVALRRAAAHVDEDVRDWMRRSGLSGAWPSGERVLALVGPYARGESVVRAAKRLAEALHAPWVVLHVERAASLEATRSALSLAEQLGAEIETRVGEDLLTTVLEAARARNATHIVMGRANQPRWRRRLRGSLVSALIDRAPDVAIHVVPLQAARRRVEGRSRLEPWWTFVSGLAAVAAITAGGALLRSTVPVEAMGMVYLTAVVGAASAAGMRVALATAALSFLAWDFFFIPPIYQFTIESPREVIGLVVFAAVAVLTGGLAGRARSTALAAQARVEGLRRLGSVSRRLGMAATEPDLLAEIARSAAEIAGRSVVLAPAGGELDIRAAVPSTDTMDEGAWAAARWCWAHGEPTGRGTATLPGGAWRFLPLRSVREKLGVLGIRGDPPPSAPALQAIAALADNAAVAWERVTLAQATARSEAMEETQRLRTSLLASLGHDLRTPLAGISGAAGTLRAAWDKLSEASRRDLLDSIEQDVARMAGFLANITEMTRLESGEVTPRLSAVPLAEIVDSAVSRLPAGPHVAVQMPDPPPRVTADPALLEQALFNVLENAVKYAPEGSLVRVRVALEGFSVVIDIADEGIGIPPEDLERVFDSFFRAGRGDRGPPGTGLGLAIARGLIESMGGTIAAQSPRHDLPADGLPGTVITIRLPGARA